MVGVMASIDFPANPTIGQTYTFLGVTYTFTSHGMWVTLGGGPAGPTGSTGPSGASGSVGPTGPSTPSSINPLMDNIAAPGVATAYSREDHVHPSDVAAAPLDALAYNGMQINGSMDVSQELGAGGSAGPLSNTSKCILDGWTIQTSGTQAVTGQQNASGIAAPGLPNTLAMYTNTANAAPAATAYANFVHSIEGYRVARLAFGTANAQPITIGFWFQAARAGLFSGAVINGASNRSYVFSFNYTTANVPQYFTVTVPGDTTGTWAKSNTAGMVLLFAAMAGSTYQTAPNVWNGGLFLGATGTTNACQTTSDYIFITGVVVLPGLEAPSSARSALIMRPYDQELVLCKRYWNTSFANFRAYAAAGGVLFSVSFAFPEMRIAPAGALLGSTGAANSTGINVNPFSSSGGFYGFQSVAGGDCYAGNSISLNARL
jgi:hypothetical protein